MAALNKLETQLDDWLNKKAPVQMPPNGRKGLAKAMWWIALVVGILQLLATFSLWHLGHLANAVITYGNYLSTTYGAGAVQQHLGLFYWLALLVLAVEAVLLLLAAPKLKQMRKGGWDLLFYGALLNALYAVVRLFTDVGGGVGNFIGAAIGSIVGAYLLFQIRDYFTGARAAHATPAAAHETAKEHAAKK